ncbi:RagB/SusD family nutrient uptake outer membrane protein [Hymenobacter sp. B81]|uniref:RagB/SusD family nutrient uptake outer membrane protein n=1 Tax=Hymenobacter sp. B81 TaxID=3344878 RepID=UPI0037DBF6EF
MKRNALRRAVWATATVAGLAGTLSSCENFLEVTPDAYSTTEDVFGTAAGATTAVLGAYDLLSGDQTYGIRISLYFPYDTDEMQGSSGTFDSGRRGIGRYRALPTNGDITNPFNNLYQGIERANVCIYNIPRMALYNGGTPADTATLHRLHGEALTLRAQFYHELIRNWGDVPTQWEPAALLALENNLNPGNAPRHATYERLLADLATAAKLVPWRSAAGTNSERITKGAVKALRARLALARGGWSANPRTGQMERPSDYLTYYEIARQECLELMAHRGEHNLNPSFAETFKSINELRRESANEIIFEVGMGGSTALSDSKLGYYNGPRLNNSTTYGTTQGAVTATPTYFYAFDSLDVRRDITLAPYTIAANNNQAATTLISIYDGKFRRDWRTPALPGTSNYLGYSWPIIRFADVLLMFAEAENEVNGPTAAALSALMEVRTRGFGGNSARAAATLGATGSKADMFNAIVQERFLEFGGEGIRKFDLLRWNLLEAKLNEVKAQIRDLRDSTGVYSKVPRVMYYRVVSGKIQWARSFYRPSPASRPSGTTLINWRQAVNNAYVLNTKPNGTSETFGTQRLTSNGSGVAAEYQPGRGKELLPYPAGSVDVNRNIQQNFGY